MAWRSGSLSRSLLTTVRSSSRSSSPPLPRLRPPPLAPPSVQSRRLSFASPAPREEWKRRVMQRTFKHPKGSENDAFTVLEGLLDQHI